MIGIIWLIGVSPAVIIFGVYFALHDKPHGFAQRTACIFLSVVFGLLWPYSLIVVIVAELNTRHSPKPTNIKIKPGTWTLNHNGSQVEMSCDVSLGNWFAANALVSRPVTHPVDVRIHHQVSEMLNVMPGDVRVKNWHPKDGDLVIITDPKD